MTHARPMTRKWRRNLACNMNSADGLKGHCITWQAAKTRFQRRSKLILIMCRVQTAKVRSILLQNGQAWARFSPLSQASLPRFSPEKKQGADSASRLHCFKGLWPAGLVCGNARKIQMRKALILGLWAVPRPRGISNVRTEIGFTIGCRTRVSSSKPPKATR